MEQRRVFFWLMLVFCCVLTCLSAGKSNNKTELSAQSRKRRFLVYPEGGSYVELIMGFGLPIVVQEQSLTMGTVIKLIYHVPENATMYTEAYTREKRASSRTSRWDIYSMLESTCDRLGLDGRACVLRAICEAADTTLEYNGIAGEVLHVILTPSTTTEASRTYMDSEYHAAERLGKEIAGSCHLLYSECKVGLLDFISKIEF